MLKLGKYSFGIGDRFAQQGKAQLSAVMRARSLGIELIPVWNKSFREHQIIHTLPDSVRIEADQAVREMGYTGHYFVDADHINLDTVDLFIPGSDFFTLDVAKYIGQATEHVPDEVMHELMTLTGETDLGDGIIIRIDPEDIQRFIQQYFTAIAEAERLYRHIENLKGAGNFITEVSMDEVSKPQSPVDLLLILRLLSWYSVPVQTIAPRFSGRFNKGVDYVGSVSQFTQEFDRDLRVIRYAISHFNLPHNLKLSIHSGSDKFSIYPVISELIRKHEAGIHVKTAGTTWLEEVVGLSLGDQEAVLFVKELYRNAWLRKEELCGPYADVIDIDATKLPSDLDSFSGPQIADLIRHIPDHPAYNKDIRQLVHVGYKLAAEQLPEYQHLLIRHQDLIAKQVEENIFDRHIKRLFS